MAGKLSDHALTVGCGVANVLTRRGFDLGEPTLQNGDDASRVVGTQRSLGQIHHLGWVIDFDGFGVCFRFDHSDVSGSFAAGTNDFLVVGVTDEQNVQSSFGIADRFPVDFGDQRARGVDSTQVAALALLRTSGLTP